MLRGFQLDGHRLAQRQYTAIPRSEATPTVVKLAVGRSSDGDRPTAVSN
ncbi:MAG: hypothetical protein RLZZ135_274 [Cyanobacteriota bacterium]